MQQALHSLSYPIFDYENHESKAPQCHQIYLCAGGNCTNEDLNPRQRSEHCGGKDLWYKGEGHEDHKDDDDSDGGELPVAAAMEGRGIFLGDKGGGMDCGDGNGKGEVGREEGEDGAHAEERDSGVTGLMPNVTCLDAHGSDAHDGLKVEDMGSEGEGGDCEGES